MGAENKVRIGLIHATMHSVAPIHKAFEQYEDMVELVNFMDEGLIVELQETNEITTRMVARLNDLAWKAVESGVDGILFTCSSFTPFIRQIARAMPVPTLSSDESMLERAIQLGSRIGVVATLEKAATTTTKMLEQIAGEQNREIDITAYVIEDAFGATGQHRLIHEQIQAIVGRYDVIVLSQYSMSVVYEELSKSIQSTVLVGPHSSARAIVRCVKQHNQP